VTALVQRLFRTHNAIADQKPPAYYRPVWHVNHLVYQGGVPMLKVSSLTGGGFVPQRSWAGREAPSWHAYATPISSAIGAGFFASRPNFLTPLGGPTNVPQF
jgi:hypothetical protein